MAFHQDHPFLILILLLFPFCILSLTSSSNSTPTPRTFRCGNSIAFSYPFWIQSQEDHYGYPGFNITCQGATPNLLISNQLYTIKSFDESEKTLIITYPFSEEHDPTCPVTRHDVTSDVIKSPLLNFTRDNQMLRFYYNCSLYPPSLPSIKCLQYGAKNSYVFIDGFIPEFDWKRYCESTMMAPVVAAMAIENNDVEYLVNVSAIFLQKGFKLTWKTDSAVCELCEATGGFCGHTNNQKFVCFCSDGSNNLSICHHKSGPIGLLMTQPNFTFTGALIFGGVVFVTCIVMYTMWKRKFGMYKLGFNHIPSDGKCLCYI